MEIEEWERKWRKDDDDDLEGTYGLGISVKKDKIVQRLRELDWLD